MRTITRGRLVVPLIVATATAALVATTAPAGAVINGSLAKANPSTVAIITSPDFPDGANKFGCNGALITPRHVLTVASCLADENGNPPSATWVMARVGSADRRKGGSVSRVQSIAIYDGFDWGENDGPDDVVGDLAVLTLSREITKQAPIELAGLNPTGDRFRAFGWGLTSEKASDVPKKLRVLPLARQKPAVCTVTSEYEVPMTAGESCLRGTKSGSGLTYGDNGAPIQLKATDPVRWTLAGSFSRFVGLHSGGAPVIATDLTYQPFVEWIDDIVAGTPTTTARQATATHGSRTWQPGENHWVSAP